jgi:hypothetical protein
MGASVGALDAAAAASNVERLAAVFVRRAANHAACSPTKPDGSGAVMRFLSPLAAATELRR